MFRKGVAAVGIPCDVIKRDWDKSERDHAVPTDNQRGWLETGRRAGLFGAVALAFQTMNVEWKAYVIICDD